MGVPIHKGGGIPNTVEYFNTDTDRLAFSTPEEEVLYTVRDSAGDGSNVPKSYTWDGSNWIEVDVGSSDDFFRATIDDSDPDGVNDNIEGIYHNGVVHVGDAKINTTTRSSHLGVLSVIGNGTFRYQTITTKIPWDSNCMPTINIKGYAYGDTDTIDLQLSFYTYQPSASGVYNDVWVSKGSISPESIKVGNEGGFVSIELDWGVGKYFLRYGVDVYSDGNTTAQKDTRFEGWTSVFTSMPVGVTEVLTIERKAIDSGPIKKQIRISPNSTLREVEMDDSGSFIINSI